MLSFLLIVIVKIIIVFSCVLLSIAYLVLLERKVIAQLQVRLGPNRVGYRGLLQPFADGIKLFFKEDIIPSKANKVLFILAPVIAMVCALLTFAVIPFGDNVTIMGQKIGLYITDINIGILYIFAIASLGIYGIVLAGWSSNNKYSLLGGMRSTAQMISYEIVLGLSIIGVLMLSGSLSLVEVVKSQKGLWNIVYQPLGFILFFIAAIAEINRSPFDLPEAESELVGGYHTEYSSMKFAMFFLAEYANMIAISSLATVLFFGGWWGPYLPGVLWFLIKVFIFLYVFIWIRATFPRLRYDQLMKFGWKFLLPLGLANIMITGLLIIIWSK